MKQVKNLLNRFFRYPLMAVMLLWALTLPGQEVEVFNFLFHGITSPAASDHLHQQGKEDQTAAVQQQAVQAFEDAKISSLSVLGPQ